MAFLGTTSSSSPRRPTRSGLPSWATSLSTTSSWKLFDRKVNRSCLSRRALLCALVSLVIVSTLFGAISSDSTLDAGGKREGRAGVLDSVAHAPARFKQTLQEFGKTAWEKTHGPTKDPVYVGLDPLLVSQRQRFVFCLGTRRSSPLTFQLVRLTTGSQLCDTASDAQVTAEGRDSVHYNNGVRRAWCVVVPLAQPPSPSRELTFLLLSRFSTCSQPVHQYPTSTLLWYSYQPSRHHPHPHSHPHPRRPGEHEHLLRPRSVLR